MEHDVVPLTGYCARGVSSERSARGTAQRAAAPGPSQKSVHVRIAAVRVLLASYTPTNDSVLYRLRVPCAQH